MGLEKYLSWLKNNDWQKSFGFNDHKMSRDFVNYLKENEPQHFQYLRLSYSLGIIFTDNNKNYNHSLWSKLVQQTDVETSKKYLSFYVFFMAELKKKKILRDFLKNNVLHLTQLVQEDYLNYLDTYTGHSKSHHKFLDVFDTVFMLECLENIKKNNDFAETMLYYFNSFEDSFQHIFLNKIDIWDDYGTDKFLNHLQAQKKKMLDGRKASILGEQFEIYTTSLFNESFNDELNQINQKKMLNIFPTSKSAIRISMNSSLYKCPKADILINTNDGSTLFVSCKSNDKKIAVHNTKWLTLIQKIPCLNPKDQHVLESINWTGEHLAGWSSLNKEQQTTFLDWLKENYLRLHQELLFGTPSVNGILVNDGKIYKSFTPYYLDYKKFWKAFEHFYQSNKDNLEALITINPTGIPSTPFILFKTMKTGKKFRVMGRIKRMAEFSQNFEAEIDKRTVKVNSKLKV